MKENYYEPSIFEFHIGFEFEYEDKKGNWIPEDFNGNYDAMAEYNLRVKYLDKSDIEEVFGIDNVTYSDNYGSIFSYVVKSEYKDFFNEVRYDTESNLMTIEFCKHSNTSERLSFANLFQGYIKNKSELVKLLQQLKIKTN